ncbi:MAG: hypothetical protein AB1746_12235 [Candidatus Zixiibacteriota bacterium]
MKIKSKYIVYVFILALGMTVITLHNSAIADDAGGYGNNVIMIGSGFLFPLRADFRDYHGSKFDMNIQSFRSIKNDLSLGIRAGYIWPDEGDIGLKYSCLNFAGLFRYYPSITNHVAYCTGGFGLNFRKLKADAADEFEPTEVEFEVSDFGPSFIFGIGAEIRPMNSIIVNLETNVDYIYDKDTDRGEFGNTGGLNILLSIGYTF